MSAKSPRTPSELLAQSWFALAFVAALIWLGSLPFMIAAPMRAAVRLPFWVVYGGYGVIVLGVTLAFLRASDDRLQQAARWMGRSVGGLRGAATVILLLELSILVMFVVRSVAPNLTPVAITLVLHSLLAITAILVINRDTLTAWWTESQGAMLGLGVFSAALLVFGGLLLINALLLNTTGLLGTLRGNFDYRELVFYGGQQNPAQSNAYWRELGAVNAQWLPYTYSRVEPLQGDYINVGADGLRQTANPVDATDAPRVFVFGGSTVWGDGARDAYTIPSHLARLLDEAGTPAHVTNFGQVAYVQMQDMILFQNQLAHGNIPDVAVFYGGFNDIMSTTMHGLAGLPHNEIKRAREFAAGRRLDDGWPVLWTPPLTLDDLDFSLVTSDDDMIEDTTAHYLAVQDQIRAIAAVYDVEVVFVWQPALNWKAPLTPEEATIQAEQAAQFPAYDDLYAGVDERVRVDAAPDRLMLTDLFDDVPDRTFIDRVHITEDGNARVAEAMLPAVQALLESE